MFNCHNSIDNANFLSVLKNPIHKGIYIEISSQGFFIKYDHMFNLNIKCNHNLGRGGGTFTLSPPCWLSLYKLETVNTVNLPFFSM